MMKQSPPWRATARAESPSEARSALGPPGHQQGRNGWGGSSAGCLTASRRDGNDAARAYIDDVHNMSERRQTVARPQRAMMDGISLETEHALFLVRGYGAGVELA